MMDRMEAKLRRPGVRRRIGALLIGAAAIAATGCSSGNAGPSIADGGLPIYSIDAPEGLKTIDVAQDLHDVLELPEEAEVKTRGPDEGRIDGADHTAVVQDRKAGSISVSYSGPRFSNAGCVRCPPLDDTDDAASAIERSRKILDAIGVDTANIVFSEQLRTDDHFFIRGDVEIDGATIDDLGFNFVWTHGEVLSRFSGGLFTVETIGTVAPRDEADARAQAETMVGSTNSITDFELTYTGGFRDGELIVAPAYLATTDLGTTFTVSAFTGKLPS